MAKFIVVYTGGNPPATPEEGKAHFAKYMEWIKGLGQAAISPMNPIKGTRSLDQNGESEGGKSGMSGYTILEASDIDAAIALCKDCPFLEIGGTLEISECVQMG